MRRFVALALLLLALAPGTWLRTPRAPRSAALELRFIPEPRPPRHHLAAQLGSFDFAGAWRITGRHWRFGGFSALVPLGDGELLAIGDRGYRLRFSPPGAAQHRPAFGVTVPRRFGGKSMIDAESAAFDPLSRRLWIGWEDDKSITRHGLAFRGFARSYPAALRHWGENLGPEAMVRLDDGRFVVLREGFSGLLERRNHQALLFTGDPTAATPPPQVFTFAGPEGYSPTDMAQLPDGRVLVLMRRLLWPLPARFTGRIAIADPRAIRPGRAWHASEVARLEAPLPVDNFEGIAVEPRRDGKVTVWLISDDNRALSQRTMLWKLVVDPARLPGASKRARGEAARPSIAR